MMYPTLKTLLKRVDSRYTLVVAASKRARQLIDGDRPLVDVETTKPVSVSINEIAQDKLTYIRK